MGFKGLKVAIFSLAVGFSIGAKAGESCELTFVNPVLSRVESTLNMFAPDAQFASGNYMIRDAASMMDENTLELVFVDVAFKVSLKGNTLTLDRQIFVRAANETPRDIAEFMMQGTIPRLMKIEQPGEPIATLPGDTGSPYSVINRSRFFVSNFSTMSDQDSNAIADAISAFIVAHMEKPARAQAN